MILKAWLKKSNPIFLSQEVILVGAAWLVASFVFWPWPESLFVFASLFSIFLFLVDPFSFLLFFLAFYPLYSGLGQGWGLTFSFFSFNYDGLLKMVYAVLFAFLFVFDRERGFSHKNTLFGGVLVCFLVVAIFRLFPDFYQSGISLAVSFALYLGVYLLVLDRAKTFKQQQKIWQVCILGLVLNLVVFGFQLWQIGAVDILSIKEGAKGFFSHAGALADYVLILSPLWLLYPPVFGGVGVFLSSIAVFFSFIRACWAGLGVFLASAAVLFRNKIIWFILFAFAVGLFSYTPAKSYLPFLNQEEIVVGSFRARTKMWQNLLGTMRKSDWFFGKGSGYSISYTASDPRFAESKYFAPHSSWVESLVDWGVVGLSIGVLLLLKIVRLFFASRLAWVRLVALNSFFFLLIKGSVASLFAIPEILVYFFTILALAELMLKKNDGAKTEVSMGG